MRVFSARLNDFPSCKARFCVGSSVPLHAAFVTPRHGGFIGRDDFVRVAGPTDLSIIDPDDAIAQPANLVELMADEDDGAAGAGDVAHFAEAFLLEVDITDGEDFIH